MPGRRSAPARRRRASTPRRPCRRTRRRSPRTVVSSIRLSSISSREPCSSAICSACSQPPNRAARRRSSRARTPARSWRLDRDRRYGPRPRRPRSRRPTKVGGWSRAPRGREPAAPAQRDAATATPDDQAARQASVAAQPWLDESPPNSRRTSSRVRSGSPFGSPARVGDLEQLVELAISQVLLATTSLLPDVVHHPHLQVGHRHLGLPPGAPPGVVGGKHLLEVLGIERLAVLRDLASGPQPQLLQPVSRVVLSEQPDPQDQSHQPTQKHDRERVHQAAVYPAGSVPPSADCARTRPI